MIAHLFMGVDSNIKYTIYKYIKFAAVMLFSAEFREKSVHKANEPVLHYLSELTNARFNEQML